MSAFLAMRPAWTGVRWHLAAASAAPQLRRQACAWGSGRLPKSIVERWMTFPVSSTNDPETPALVEERSMRLAPVSWVWLGSLSALSVVRRWAPGRAPVRVTAREPRAARRAAGLRVVSGCAPDTDWGSPASAADCWDRPAGSDSAFEQPQIKSFCLWVRTLRTDAGSGRSLRSMIERG